MNSIHFIIHQNNTIDGTSRFKSNEMFLVFGNVVIKNMYMAFQESVDYLGEYKK